MTDISSKKQPTAIEIKNWLVVYLAELLEVEPKEIGITVPFNNYGLDSAAALCVVGELEEWLDLKLAPTLLYKYPTIEALTAYLFNKLIKL